MGMGKKKKEKEIEFLEWDSNFFSMKIGMFFVNKNINILNVIKDFDLIYLYSDKDNLAFPLVDKKVTFEIENLHNIVTQKDNNIHFYNKNDNYSEILNLSYQCGEYSRFKTDKNFKNGEYEKLYKEWIDKSISKEIAKEILVYKIYNKIAGFATIGVKNNVLEIGLVGVDKNYRGIGLGIALIDATILRAKNLGYSSLQVVTQLDNLPAVNLYYKAGFKIKDIKYIYHIWKDDTI